jgi:hypothetical protein
MKPKKMRAREGLADDGIMSAEIIALAHALSAAGSAAPSARSRIVHYLSN